MEKKQKAGAGSKKANKVVILFSVMALTVLLVVELYIMINDSQSYINMAIVGVIMLVLVYLLATSILKQNEKRQKKLEEQYENVFKSEKASYILLRKHFMEMEERLNKIEKSTALPKDEIVAIQKAIAKITISRSKENTDALMNSNDKMIDKLYNFENLLEESNNNLLERQKKMLEESNEEISTKQHEMEGSLVNIAAELKELLAKGINTEALEKEPEIVSEAEESEVVSEPEAAPVEEEPKDIEALLAGMGNENAVTGEEEAAPPKSALEALAKHQSEEEPEEEPVVPEIQEEPEAEPAVPEIQEEPQPVSEPDSSQDLDPNRKMSPEEIAALFSNL